MKLLITCEIVVLIFSITKVTAQKGPGRVIVHPGQDVELLCTVIENSPARTEGWLVNNAGPYGINALRNGILSKHSASLDGGNLMVENITKNDGRNGSEYICVIVPAEGDTITIGDIINQSDPTFLYVTGVPTMIPNVMHMVDINTYENNVTLTLSWGEPFNNFDPIVNYTVSCSGDVTCPPNYTTTDNTTRSYTITNLTPMTNYIFSVVATNSIGSGEAADVVVITTTEPPPYSRILASKPCSVTKVDGEVNSNRKRKRTKVEFTSDGVSGVKYQCKVDDDKFEDCESPVIITWTNLKKGRHTFTIRTFCIDDEKKNAEEKFKFRVR